MKYLLFNKDQTSDKFLENAFDKVVGLLWQQYVIKVDMPLKLICYETKKPKLTRSIPIENNHSKSLILSWNILKIDLL